MEHRQGLLECLFDTSFSEFITTRLIRFLYVVGLVVAGLGAVGFVIGGFSGSVANGIICLIIAPLLFLIYVIMIRIWLELLIVIFRIEENTRPIPDESQPAP